jgi:hypothetical protein
MRRLAAVRQAIRRRQAQGQCAGEGVALGCRARAQPEHLPVTGFVHDGSGAAIEDEIYELGAAAFGSFVAEMPPPLAIGTVTLPDGSLVKGFVAEPRAIVGAEDITVLGGWRAYIAR